MALVARTAGSTGGMRRELWRIIYPLLILCAGMALIKCVAPPPVPVITESEVSVYAN